MPSRTADTDVAGRTDRLALLREIRRTIASARQTCEDVEAYFRDHGPFISHQALRNQVSQADAMRDRAQETLRAARDALSESQDRLKLARTARATADAHIERSFASRLASSLSRRK